MNQSAIYVGRLGHSRLGPRPHAFSYPLYMLYLDLDELDAAPSTFVFGIEAARPLSFRRRDYLGSGSLKQAVADEVERATGVRPRGPIRLLTHVRAFGYVFNPVSFYYCFKEDGQSLAAVVAEITNTPWGERHCYVLPACEGGAQRSFPKAFHVSPFFGMAQVYDWDFTSPGKTLAVSMTNHEAGRPVFHADLTLSRRPFKVLGLLSLAVRWPAMSLLLHAAIYYQALRLWLKGIPFLNHPATRPGRGAEESR